MREILAQEKGSVVITRFTECELILNDAADCCSSGFSVHRSVDPYLSLKPLVEVLRRGEKEPNQVKKHYAW